MAKPTGMTVDIRPAPSLVQAALDHCEIPLVYNDDHTIKLPPPEERDMVAIFSAVINLAMTKHIEDTMILPTAISRLREVMAFLTSVANSDNLAQDFGSLAEMKDQASEMWEALDRVALSIGNTR